MSSQFYRLALESLIFQLFPRIRRALEWMQDRMPFTNVVVPTLIAIMKDQEEHLNKIGVAVAMMGEDVDEAVKSGSREIVYWSLKSWLSKEWTKELRRKAWNASCSYRYWRGPINHWMVNFPFNCCAFSLLEFTICIKNGFLSKWAIFFCHLIHNFVVTYTLK